MTSNVVLFPKGKKDSPPQTMEELMNGVLEVRRGQIDFLVDDIGSFIMGRSAEEGFDLMTEDNMRVNILMIECVRAALFESIGMKHYLHEELDRLVTNEQVEEMIVPLTANTENVTKSDDDEQNV